MTTKQDDGGWLPIETAPKDGSVVDLYTPEGDTVRKIYCWWHVVEKAFVYLKSPGVTVTVANPSHWRRPPPDPVRPDVKPFRSHLIDIERQPGTPLHQWANQDAAKREAARSESCPGAQADEEIRIYAEEAKLLRLVFSASSDLVLGRHDDLFASANGGICELEKAHAQATRNLEEWYGTEN